MTPQKKSPPLSFTEKIKAILDNNAFNVNSPNGIEKFLKLGNGTIKNACKKNREPSIMVMKKLLNGLNINPAWWQTCEGSMFIERSDNALWQLVKEQRDHIQTQNDLLRERERVNRLQELLLDEMQEKNLILERRLNNQPKTKPHEKSKKESGRKKERS